MHYIIYIFFLICNLSFSQGDKKISNEQAAKFITQKATDCKDAIRLNVTKTVAFIYTTAPKGFGVQEMRSSIKNDKSFGEEHNSTWFLLIIQNSGELVFEINPIDSTNDYDFLLYPYIDSSFCSELMNNKIVPLRSNLSLPDVKSNGKTGLGSKALTNYTGKNNGQPFSKSIRVREGEKYMLVIDNNTTNGKGYGITFNCVNKITINGKVFDEYKHPMGAYISLIDRNNNEIVKVKNSENGSYKFTTEVKEEVDYSLLFYNETHLPSSVIVNTNSIDTSIGSLTIDQTLLKLKLGETYNLVYFSQVSLLLNVEGTPILGLVEIMKKNPKMKIQIQGHAAKYELTKNDNQINGGFKIDKMIAEERANFVYLKLIQNGIAKERMEKMGLSSDQPVILHPQTEKDKNKNKGVSIKILSL